MALLINRVSNLSLTVKAGRVGRKAWALMPSGVQQLAPVRRVGNKIHGLVLARGARYMNPGTFMLRNRPELDFIHSIAQRRQGGKFRVAVLGCSIGMEVYSIRWRLRDLLSKLDLEVIGSDIDPVVIDTARRAIYPLAKYDWTLKRLTETESQQLFETTADAVQLRPEHKSHIRWQKADAFDVGLKDALGPQDLVVANRFLCHMSPDTAAACLRNITNLVAPGGYLFVSGVDLPVRQAVMTAARFEPVAERLAEIHEGDPSIRTGWPWAPWGLEPLDRSRPDWLTRYAMVWRRPAVGA